MTSFALLRQIRVPNFLFSVPALEVAREIGGYIIAGGSSCPLIPGAATSLEVDCFRLGDSFNK